VRRLGARENSADRLRAALAERVEVPHVTVLHVFGVARCAGNPPEVAMWKSWWPVSSMGLPSRRTATSRHGEQRLARLDEEPPGRVVGDRDSLAVDVRCGSVFT